MEWINGTWVFDSREDVIREIVEGPDRNFLMGAECPVCGHIKVLNFRQIMVPFSNERDLKTPPGVTVEIERGDPMVSEFVPSPRCRNDGTEMKWLGGKSGDWFVSDSVPKKKRPT